MSLLSSLPGLRRIPALEEQLAATKAQVRSLRDELAEQKQTVKALGGRGFDPHVLKAVLTGDGRHYQSADPFPHVVIDNFLKPDMLQRVVTEFTGMDRTTWHRTNGANEKKLSTEDYAHFGPFTAKVITALNSGPFLAFLEQLTGISGIIADPHLRGGGLHEIEPGGKLGVHADFNFYERFKLYRRLNLLLYLNTNWEDGWGGQLELWSRDGKTRVKAITPMFNRAVIFDTSNKSYHGHPHPLACPAGETRKSLALYYYTAEYPYQDDLAPHSTLFVDAGNTTP